MLDDLYNNEDAFGMNLKIDIVDDKEGETGQDDIECDSDFDDETGSKTAKAGSSSQGICSSFNTGFEVLTDCSSIQGS